VHNGPPLTALVLTAGWRHPAIRSIQMHQTYNLLSLYLESLSVPGGQTQKKLGADDHALLVDQLVQEPSSSHDELMTRP